MFSLIPIYMILAIVSCTELELSGYIPPMSPLQSYGLSLLAGIAVFAYVEYATWPTVRGLLQLARPKTEQPPAPALMKEGGK
jgi:hypothetical protein